MVKRTHHSLTAHVESMAAHRTHHKREHTHRTAEVLREADQQTRKEEPTNAGTGAVGHAQR